LSFESVTAAVEVPDGTPKVLAGGASGDLLALSLPLPPEFVERVAELRAGRVWLKSDIYAHRARSTSAAT
jgi:hypothetical protein